MGNYFDSCLFEFIDHLMGTKLSRLGEKFALLEIT